MDVLGDTCMGKPLTQASFSVALLIQPGLHMDEVRLESPNYTQQSTAIKKCSNYTK